MTTDGKVELIVSKIDVEESASLLEGGAIHLVQIVRVEVLVTVETVVVICSICSVPDVILLVTGQVVKVVKTLHC